MTAIDWNNILDKLSKPPPNGGCDWSGGKVEGLAARIRALAKGSSTEEVRGVIRAIAEARIGAIEEGRLRTLFLRTTSIGHVTYSKEMAAAKRALLADGAELDVTIGRFTRYVGDSTLWETEVNGVKITFTNDQINENAGFAKCVLGSALGYKPAPVNADVWRELVNKWSAEAEVIHLPPDATFAGQVLYHLREYCTGKARAKALDEILLGNPWTDGGRTYFIPSFFYEFLFVRHFAYKADRLSKVLHEIGLALHQTVLKGKLVQYWSIPKMQGQTEKFDAVEVPRDAAF